MADGILKVGTITTSSGSGTITLGQSGETVDMTNGSITLNSDMKNTPAFQAYRTATQSLNNSTFTKVQNNVVLFDTDSAYDNSTNYRFTIPSGKAGKYVFGVQCNIHDLPDQMYAYALIYKNGSKLKENIVSASRTIASWGRHEYYEAQNATAILDLSAGDVVKHVCNQDSGSSRNLGDTDQGAITFFGGFRITT